MLDLREDDFRWLLKWLKKERNCEPALFQELARTAGVQQKIKALSDGRSMELPEECPYILEHLLSREVS